MSTEQGVGRSNTGNGAKYLRIAGGSIWQTSGDIDKENPNYQESPWETQNSSGIRKGYRFDFIQGTLNGVFFKESEYGETLSVYIDTTEGLYCLQFKIDGTWSSYQLAKKMMIALLSLDINEFFRIDVYGTESNGFTNVNFYVKQDGKSLTLETKWDDVDEDKFKPIPSDIKELIINDVEVVSQAEMKDMTRTKKEMARYNELDALKNLVNELVVPSANEKVLEEQAEQEKESEVKQDEDKEEVAKEVKQVTNPKSSSTKAKVDGTKTETMKEKLARLKAEREAKK